MAAGKEAMTAEGEVAAGSVVEAVVEAETEEEEVKDAEPEKEVGGGKVIQATKWKEVKMEIEEISETRHGDYS